MGTGAIGECVYCGESVELAEDGAWQGVEDGACGCMESLDKGGDGEHVGDEAGAADAALAEQTGGDA